MTAGATLVTDTPVEAAGSAEEEEEDGAAVGAATVVVEEAALPPTLLHATTAYICTLTGAPMPDAGNTSSMPGMQVEPGAPRNSYMASGSPAQPAWLYSITSRPSTRGKLVRHSYVPLRTLPKLTAAHCGLSES